MPGRALALGFFDGVHLGHGALLRRTRALADELGLKPSALTFSPHPSALLSERAVPLLTLPRERERLMYRLYGMEELIVLPFDKTMCAMSPESFVDEVLVDRLSAAALVCGQDYRFGAGGKGTAAFLREACNARRIPFAEVAEVRMDGKKVSSTAVRALLERGEVAQAMRYLGHPHLLAGTVVGGKQLGRTLGIPTANLELSSELLLPRYGVYAAKAFFDGQSRNAVVNIGVRPTVNGKKPTVEPWILDFDGDLYGHELTLALYEFLRTEQKFPTPLALSVEVRKNAEQTRRYFATHEYDFSIV